jgi:asparagine synthetase B (glutamine-hydrolysing)
MCSFIFNTAPIANLAEANFFSCRRGPDATTELRIDNYHLVHNLLSITGAFTTQPFSKGDIHAIYNGQIYNFKEFNPNYSSDGECLIDLYEESGPTFTRNLDGEFALLILDLKRQRIIISTDIFGTKPLWLALNGKDLGVATYKSSLAALSYTEIRQVPPNTTIVYNISTHSIDDELLIHEFDLRQYKDSYHDWIEAFSQSIRKRAAGLREKVFIGLSGGYDSGGIACELLRQGLHFHSYSLSAKENLEVIFNRVEKISNSRFLSLSKEEYVAEKAFLKETSEPYECPARPPHRPDGYLVTNDKGAVGTGVICRLARNDGCKIYLSGQGSDEIMSDYGFAGAAAKGVAHTDLYGYYPSELIDVFPWTNFFEGTQREFLYKDESVGGAYGIECRYPYLDKMLVQEFLWLSQDLKNQRYKAPLGYYFQKFGFPFSEGLESKVGFCADYFGEVQKIEPPMRFRNFIRRVGETWRRSRRVHQPSISNQPWRSFFYRRIGTDLEEKARNAESKAVRHDSSMDQSQR